MVPAFPGEADQNHPLKDQRLPAQGSFFKKPLRVTLPETNIFAPEFMDGWNTFSFPFGKPYFQVRAVSFRECI